MTTVYGADRSEIDQTTVVVAPVASIALDFDVQSEVTVLAGDDAFSVHGTVKGSDGVTLVGDGAIQFRYEGVLTETNGAGLCVGDCGGFYASDPGEGAVVLRTATASTAIVVHAVAASAVDAIAFQPTSLDLYLNSPTKASLAGWPYTLSIGGTVVYGTGIQCASSDPAVASSVVNLLGDELAGGTGGIGVFGSAPGSATITCAMNAAVPHTWTIPVTVH